MPQTPTYGFEYETPQSKPGITLTGDIDGSSPILAEQVEIVIAGIDSRVASAEEDISILQAGAAHDSGWLAFSTTAAAGWSTSISVYRQFGPILMARLEYQRTGADIVASSAGNVTGDPLIATINTAALRPSESMPVFIQASVTSGGGLLNTAGAINLTDMHSNSTIATNNFVRISPMYFAASFI